MDVGIDRLCVVFPIWSNYESVVGVHVSGLVDGVIARPNSPGRISPLVTVIMGVIVVLLKVRSWRQGEVHKMGDGGLALAAIDGLHGGLQKSSAVDERELVDRTTGGELSYRLRKHILVRQTCPSLCFMLLA